MSVSGDIFVGNTSKWQPQPRQLDDPMEQRLQQYYTGRVTIRGSLTVTNVLRDTANSLIVLGNQSLARKDIQSTYLLDQTPQVEIQLHLIHFNDNSLSAEPH